MELVYRQVTDFARIASNCGAEVVHVKAHGALYNQAVRDSTVCRAILEGVAGWNIGVVLVGLAGSPRCCGCSGRATPCSSGSVRRPAL